MQHIARYLRRCMPFNVFAFLLFLIVWIIYLFILYFKDKFAFLWIFNHHDSQKLSLDATLFTMKNFIPLSPITIFNFVNENIRWYILMKYEKLALRYSPCYLPYCVQDIPCVNGELSTTFSDAKSIFLGFTYLGVKIQPPKSIRGLILHMGDVSCFGWKVGRNNLSHKGLTGLSEFKCFL